MRAAVSIVIAMPDSPGWTPTERMLERALPATFVRVHSPQELVELVKRQDQDIDIAVVADEFCESGTVIRTLRRENPDISVVVVVGDEDLSTVLERIREGAVDCIPRDNAAYGVDAIERLLEERSLRAQSKELRRHLMVNHLEEPQHFSDIITTDPRMFGVFMFVESVAESKFPVLISGETGTGKDLLVQAIHAASGRKGPLVVENVAGLDDTLFSDALFGHEAGAYTGAERSRPGLVQQAAGGTVFLDEIGDLDIRSQVKLLRLLENNEYYPLGSDEPRTTDARFVVATNRDLDQRMAEGSFRSDLYYRLTTHAVELPPLRERNGDVAVLFRHFVARCALDLDRPTFEIVPEVIEILRNYSFPGNVRELKAISLHAVESGVNGIISRDQLLGINQEVDELVHEHAPPAGNDEDGRVSFPETLPTIDRVTDLLIDEALLRAGGNQSRAAEMIGITPSAVSKRLKKRRTE